VAATNRHPGTTGTTPDDRPSARSDRGSIVLAALALPGLLPTLALAENAPEHALIQFKTEHYQDSQPGFTRVTIDEPSLYALLPLGEHWSIEGSGVYDAVSGASPRYYTAVSGASRLHDKRYAGDVDATYYGARSAFGLSYARSDENDYLANSVSADARFSSQDNNTTFNVGLSAGRDKIDPTNQIVRNEHKTTYSGIVGVTQALSAIDLAQFQVGYSIGRGYFSDPYKLFDNRPRRRESETASLRWNHHFAGAGASLRTSYRFYHDSYGIYSHTVDLQWVQPVSESWILTPGLRYYTQNSAKFYIDPPADAPFPSLPDGIISSLDQRLSAFGAIAASQKIEWRLSPHWSTDLKGEYYQQRASFRFIGRGSPGLDRFDYYVIQFGVTYRY